MTKRSTSIAKSAAELRADWFQENYGLAKSDFNHAREDDPSIKHENSHLLDKHGSKMVANDQPTPRIKPPQEIGKSVDRESFDQRWIDEQSRADQEPSRDNDYER